MNTRRSGGGNEHSFAEVKPDLYPINAKICQLVEQFPCMYNRSHPHYLKKEVVEKAWVKIAKEMNESISLCKERWRNIRTSFARSINVRKVPASANRTKPYYLHEELKFLTHHITPGVPVPRRVAIKRRLHSRNSTLGEDDAESEEIKVSMSEESFDSFAALVPDQNGDDEEENDEDDNADEHEKSRMQPAVDVSNADSNLDNTTSDSEQQDSHLGVEYQMSMSDAQLLTAAAAAPPAAVAVEVAPIVLPNVCPCPPKKRQRLLENIEDDALPSMGDNEAKIQVNTIQPLQQQQQQQQQLQQTQEPIRATAGTANTTVNDSDFDDAFLQGIRPEMKAMTFQQKVYFKRRIYDLLGEIFPLTSNLSAVNASDASVALNESVSDLNSSEMLRRLNSLLAPTLTQPPTVTVPIAYSNPNNNNNNNNNTSTSTNLTVSPMLMPPRLRAVGRPNHVAVAATQPNAAQRAAPQLVVRVPKPTATTFQPLTALLNAANGQPVLKQEAPDQSDN